MAGTGLERVMTGEFELDTRLLGPLPVVNAFCARLGLDPCLGRFLWSR